MCTSPELPGGQSEAKTEQPLDRGSRFKTMQARAGLRGFPSRAPGPRFQGSSATVTAISAAPGFGAGVRAGTRQGGPWGGGGPGATTSCSVPGKWCARASAEARGRPARSRCGAGRAPRGRRGGGGSGARACWRCWLRPSTRPRAPRASRPPSTAACAGTRRWSGARCTSSASTTS